jgi:predicted ATPase/class 3 adenylate cyclase
MEMSTRELPSGIVTFWFTDIERSTRLLQELGHDVFASVLEDHNQILAQIVGSSLISTEGDSFFCVFSSPVDAVQSAASAQRELENHSWPDRGRVRVRIGMHTGPARLGGADFVGLDVHRAARISAAGHGGQVLMSDTTRALVDNHLPEGTSLVDLGEHHLKDLLHPEHLFQLNIDGLQDSFPPVISKYSGRVRIPEPTTEFVGRQDELRGIEAALARSRLVTLVGLGGVGKTRLALQAAKTGDFGSQNSVFFIGLAESTDGAAVAKSAADSISLSERAGSPIERTLIDYLRNRGDLLIFDNCEHLVDDVAALIELLLRECPDVRIVATSREPLLIDGEHIVNITPLRVSDGGQGTHPGDAVDLFVLRAKAGKADFDPSLWGEEIEAICRRLEGIPLAIELAAARIPVLTPGEILGLLDHRFSLLTTRRRGAAPRHQTLEATLDWSYELLEPELQELLSRLSVFRGGFSIEAAERVCFEPVDDPSLVLDRLTALYERSLLQRATTSGRTRFHLLETVREYAHGKLVEGHGEEAAFAHHRDFFFEFLRHQTALLGGSDQLEALEMLETDHDNVREVMDRAMATGDLGLAADFAGRLAWFWYVHGHFMEGERRAQGLLENLPSEPDRHWLRLLIASAQFDYRLGRFDRAATKLERAIEGSKRSGERRLEMWAHAYSATNEVYRMEFSRGQDEAKTALELAEDEGDLLAFSYVKLIQSGAAAFRLESQGKLTSEKASELKAELDPLAEVARNIGERNVIGHVMEAQGVLSLRTGDTDGASTALDRAIVALTELGTVGCACHCLEAIALCAAEVGLLTSAVRLIGASDGLREMVGIKVSPMEEPFRRGTLETAARSRSTDSIQSLQASGTGLSMRETLQLARDTLARFSVQAPASLAEHAVQKGLENPYGERSAEK